MAITPVKNQPTQGGLTPLPDEPDYSPNADSIHNFIEALLERQTNLLESEQDTKLRELKVVIDSQDDDTIKKVLASGDEGRILEGLAKIKELDEILETKSEVARSLSRQESVITVVKPKKTREPVGKEVLKGYQPGNFIERNKVLGPDARYYSALSQDEKSRVDKILETNAYEKEDIDIEFIPTEEMNVLQGIDKKLSMIIPETEWESKSIRSGMSTPMSGICTPKRSINDIMADTALFNDIWDKERLQEIDRKLQLVESRPVSRQELERVFMEIV